MTLIRQQSVFTYESSSGGVAYYFDIVVDTQGLISVRNIRAAYGATDCSTSIPSYVLDDIERAKMIVQQQVAETSVQNGIVVFTGQVEQTVMIPAGILNNTNYRVAYSVSDATVLKTEDKTTTSFKIVAPCAYGSPTAPKNVDYVVLVSTQQASTTSGFLTFQDFDIGQKSVTFATPFTTDDYRVVLTPDDFSVARVINKTKTGFTVELGYTLLTGDTAEVGFDVFV